MDNFLVGYDLSHVEKESSDLWALLLKPVLQYLWQDEKFFIFIYSC